MSTKSATWIGIAVGSTVGGALPALWGGSMFGFQSLFLSAAGAILGIYIGFKLTN